MAATPIIDKSGWQTVLAGTAQTPTTVVEPYPMPHPLPKPYNDFEIAIKVLKKPVTDYVQGYLDARALLVGGAAPDFVTGKTVSLFQDERKKTNETSYETGGMDAWRLYGEHGNLPPEQWVDDVIKDMKAQAQAASASKK